MAEEGHKSFTYNLELNEEQARTVLNALEFYARMAIGQWDEVGRQFLDLKDDMHVEKMDELKRGMAKLRKIVYPELPEDMSASYGVGAIPKACAVWEIYEVLRHCKAWAEHPEGGYTVDFGRPISFSGKPLAKCTAKKDEHDVCMNCRHFLGGGDWGLACGKHYHKLPEALDKACEDIERKEELL